MNLQFRIKIYFIYTIPSVRFKVADGTKTGCNFQIESYPILASSQHIGATARLTTTAPYLTIVGIRFLPVSTLGQVFTLVKLFFGCLQLFVVFPVFDILDV